MAIPTTAEWRSAIGAQFRQPGHVRITVDLMADVSKADIEAQASSTLPITNIDTTIDAQEPTYELVATMEGLWPADGSAYLPSDNPEENKELPWWSENVLQDPVTLTYDFGGSLASFIGLTVLWDTMFNSWPTSLIVRGFSDQDAELYTYSLSNLSGVKSILNTPMDKVAYITITILAWSDPRLRARMTEIYFGVVFELTGKDIYNTEESNTIDLVGEDLPTDTFTMVLRNQIYREAVVRDVTGSTQRSHPLTDISRIFNGNADNDGPISTVEVLYWVADGSQYLPSQLTSENLRLPWMSDTNMFDPDNPIIININYKEAVHINQFSITWDNVTDSWPVSYKLVGYNDLDQELFSRPLEATGVVSTISEDFGTVKRVELYIYRWSKPGWRARISQFETILVYGNNLIPSEVNNLFDPTLEFGYSKYLATRQRISIYYGFEIVAHKITWLPPQIKYLSAWSIPVDSTEVTFDSDTILSFLDSDFVLGNYTGENRSFYDVALYVLQNSDIIKSYAGDEPWELPNTLKQWQTNAPITKEATNAILQLLAGATAHILDCNPLNGRVRFRENPFATEYVIDATKQQGAPAVEIQDPLRSVAINIYTYTKDTKDTELYNSTVVLQGTHTVRAPYKSSTTATECVAEVSGATLESAAYYSQYAILQINAGDAPSSVSIKITGKVVDDSAVTVEYYRDDTITSGLDIEIDNPYITNTDVAQHLANFLIAYYSKRQLMEVPYLGYPDLKSGDSLAVYSQYLNDVGTILDSSLSFNGGFSGTLKVLMEGQTNGMDNS